MSAAALQETNEGKTIVTARDLARRYRVSPECIGRWAKLGKIPSIKFEGVLRFDLESVIAVIEGKDETGGDAAA